ncbi:MAG: hypothetical protein VB104_09255 [Candidatus Limiplasma sp.]|nr:hypothetical protein [Candidatus Limiplasma sp.]
MRVGSRKAPDTIIEVNSMEGLIVLAVLYFLFRAIARKGREVTANVRRGNEAPMSAATPVKPQSAPVKRANPPAPRPTQRALPTTKPRMQTALENASTEGEAAYKPIQPSVRLNATLGPYTGSMGATPMEGLPSMEGSDTCDPSLEHGRTFTPRVAAYAMGEQQPTEPVLPEAWNAKALVQGVVMQEILNRPRTGR